MEPDTAHVIEVSDFGWSCSCTPMEKLDKEDNPVDHEKLHINKGEKVFLHSLR